MMLNTTASWLRSPRAQEPAWEFSGGRSGELARTAGICGLGQGCWKPTKSWSGLPGFPGLQECAMHGSGHWGVSDRAGHWVDVSSATSTWGPDGLGSLSPISGAACPSREPRSALGTPGGGDTASGLPFGQAVVPGLTRLPPVPALLRKFSILWGRWKRKQENYT